MIQEFDKELNAIGRNKIITGRLLSEDSLLKIVTDSLFKTIMESKSLSYVPSDIAVKSIAIDETPIKDYSWNSNLMNKYTK